MSHMLLETGQGRLGMYKQKAESKGLHNCCTDKDSDLIFICWAGIQTMNCLHYLICHAHGFNLPFQAYSVSTCT